MTNNNKKLFWLTLGLIILAEIISLVGFSWPIVVNLATALLILITLFLTLKQPAYGLLILLVELLIGSQGYLLWIGQAGNHISLRIALWIVVMSIWLVKELTVVIKTKKLSSNWRDFKIYWPFGLLILAIVLAGLIGLINHNDKNLIFIEAKRWLYLITIIPLVMTLKAEDWQAKFSVVVAAACTWLALKTLILLYIFSHGLVISDLIYAWTRADLLGEITKLPNGFSRVFLQSQVFSIPAFIFSLIIFIKTLVNKHWQLSNNSIIYGLASALFLSVIIVSLSRSFWVGLALGLIFIIFIVLRFIKITWSQVFKTLVYLLGVGLATIVILFITLEFPIPKPLFGFSASLLSNRATELEAAANSRLALWPVISAAVIKQPILGYGLGKTLTYKTNDPRVVKSSIDGKYTTNAFEWGWLDIWLKLGLLGLVAYLWLFMALGKLTALKIKTNPWQALAVIGSILALITLNTFTPYLNHPLGFAYLAIMLIIVLRSENNKQAT